MNTQTDKAERRDKKADGALGIDRAAERLESRRDSKEERRVAGELKGQRARGRIEKLLTRALSGVIYVLVIVGCLVWGRAATSVLMAAMSWACCSEFFRMTRMAGRRPSEMIGLSAAAVFPVAASLYGPRMVMCAACVLLLAVSTWYVFNARANVADVAVSMFGPVYTALPLSCLAMVRASDPGLQGALLTLVVIGSIWAEDSFAYLLGSAFGKHKMAPRTSPNKSWEGFFGGLVGSLAVWCVGAAFHVAGLTFPLAVSCALVEGIVAVMGDLFESRIKRGVGVKDSGNLLPGHGGLLDRTDSILFGSIVAYFFLLMGGLL